MGLLPNVLLQRNFRNFETKLVNKFFSLPLGKPKNFEAVLAEI